MKGQQPMLLPFFIAAMMDGETKTCYLEVQNGALKSGKIGVFQ